jgi:hypothetical protein
MRGSDRDHDRELLAERFHADFEEFAREESWAVVACASVRALA